MCVHYSSRRLFYISFAKETIREIYLNEPTGIKYRDLQRELGNPYYRFFNLHLKVLRECDVITKPLENRKPGPTSSMHLTDKGIKAYKKYENKLRLPNIDTANIDSIKNRVLIFMLSMMEYNISNRTNHFLWNSLKSFPFVSEQNIRCKNIEQNIGMSLAELIAQRTIKDDYMLFKNNDLKYTSEEIREFTAAMLASNNTEPILRPIEVNGKLRTEREDQLLCDYIARCQALLFIYKYCIEYEIMARLVLTFPERQMYKNFILPQICQWYKATFGIRHTLKMIEKSWSNFIKNSIYIGLDKRVEMLRTKIEYLEDYIRATDKFIYKMFGRTYRTTRQKYELFVNTMEKIVLPIS
jgi:DNA-binding HxlR family transcriptional regulator